MPLAPIKFIKLAYLGFVALLLTGCDPLAPELTPRVIVVTRTPNATAIGLAPTVTLTPIPPTDIPTEISTEVQSTETAAVDAVPPKSPTPTVCTEGRGQVVDLNFTSKIAKGKVRYRVFLPPCYTDSARRYPYLILMHGSDQDEKEWTDLLKVHEALESGIALQVLPPMILVMPYGGESANTNIFTRNASWEYVVVDELMPDVEQNLCTWNAREGRAIGGISRGGFWAFEIAFRHPDLFGAVGGHSAYFDPKNAPADYNPMSLAKTIEFAPGMQPRIYMDVAHDDPVRPNMEVVQKTLAGRNIDPGYVTNPDGTHEIDYWAAHVSEYLSFYGQTWPRDAKELPSCLQ